MLKRGYKDVAPVGCIREKSVRHYEAGRMEDYRITVNTGRRSYYVEGSAVRKNAPGTEAEPRIRRVNHAARRNRDRARHMNAGYVLFLAIAVCITAITLLGYIRTQSQLTVSAKRVANLERELEDLRRTNDQNLDRINAAVNLEDIKQVAVNELGMTYAKEGQVVVVGSEGSDYVRQLRELQ